MANLAKSPPPKLLQFQEKYCLRHIRPQQKVADSEWKSNHFFYEGDKMRGDRVWSNRAFPHILDEFKIKWWIVGIEGILHEGLSNRLALPYLITLALLSGIWNVAKGACGADCCCRGVEWYGPASVACWWVDEAAADVITSVAGAIFWPFNKVESSCRVSSTDWSTSLRFIR